MSLLTQVNIAIDIFCVAVCSTVLTSLLYEGRRNIKQNAYFAFCVASSIGLLISDGIGSIASENYGALFHNASWVANFFYCLFGTLIFISYTLYLAEVLELKTPQSRRMIKWIVAVCIISITGVVISQFTHMYYWIDENNHYQRGPLYWLCQLFVFSIMMMDVGVILMQWKKKSRKDILILLSYIALPLVGNALHMIADDLALIAFGTTLAILIIYLGIQRQQAKKMRQQELEMMENRISIMLSQIQPHFLHNALNTIDALFYCDEKKAHEAICKFSNYLRNNMDSLSQKGRIPFSKELEHTRQYLWLEELRFEERLQVVYQIEAVDFLIPALTLQPIVENAVRYGITPRPEGGTLVIRTEDCGECFRITVADDGTGFDPTMHPDDGRSHIGIANVRNRIAAMCGGRLEIQSEPQAGTTVVMEIPK